MDAMERREALTSAMITPAYEASAAAKSVFLYSGRHKCSGISGFDEVESCHNMWRFCAGTLCNARHRGRSGNSQLPS